MRCDYFKKIISIGVIKVTLPCIRLHRFTPLLIIFFLKHPVMYYSLNMILQWMHKEGPITTAQRFLFINPSPCKKKNPPHLLFSNSIETPVPFRWMYAGLNRPRPVLPSLLAETKRQLIQFTSLIFQQTCNTTYLLCHRVQMIFPRWQVHGQKTNKGPTALKTSFNRTY